MEKEKHDMPQHSINNKVELKHKSCCNLCVGHSDLSNKNKQEN